MLTADKRQQTQQNVLHQLQQMLPGRSLADLQGMMASMDTQVYQASGGVEDAYINKMAAKLNNIKRKLAKQAQEQAQQVQPPFKEKFSNDSGSSASRQASLSQQHHQLLNQQQQMLSQQQQRMQQAQYGNDLVQQPGGGYPQQGYGQQGNQVYGASQAGSQSQALLQGQRPTQASPQQRYATTQARPGQRPMQQQQQQQAYMGNRFPGVSSQQQTQPRPGVPLQQQQPPQYQSPSRVMQQTPQQAMGGQQQQQWRGAPQQQQQQQQHQPTMGGPGGLSHPVGGASGLGDNPLHATPSSQDWIVDMMNEFILRPPDAAQPSTSQQSGAQQQTSAQYSGVQYSGAQYSGQAHLPPSSLPSAATYTSSGASQQGQYALPAASAGHGYPQGPRPGQPGNMSHGMPQQFQSSAPSTSQAGQGSYGQQFQQLQNFLQPRTAQQPASGFMAMLTENDAQYQGYEQPQAGRPPMNAQAGPMPMQQQQQQQLRAQQQQARARPAGSVGSAGGSNASGTGSYAVAGTAAAQQGDQTELYWEVLAELNREIVPTLEAMKTIFEKAKAHKEGSEKTDHIAAKLGHVIQLLPRLKIKRTDPMYANCVWSAERVEELRRFERQLRPWCAKFKQTSQEKKATTGTASASSGGAFAAPSPGVSSGKQLTVQLDSVTPASPPIVLSPPLSDAQPTGVTQAATAVPTEIQVVKQSTPKAALSGKSEEPSVPQDARARILSAITALSGPQSSQQSSETQQAVLQLLWQMDTDVPTPPADLVLLPPSNSRQILSKRSHSATAQNFVLPLQTGSPASVLDDPRGFEIKRARSASDFTAEVEQRRSVIEQECLQAKSKLGTEVAFLVTPDPDVHGSILVHLSPAPSKTQGLLTEQWRLMSMRVGSSYPAVAPTLLFHSTTYQGQEFFKAEAACSVFETSISAVPQPLTIEAAATKWLEALQSVDQAYRQQA